MLLTGYPNKPIEISQMMIDQLKHTENPIIYCGTAYATRMGLSNFGYNKERGKWLQEVASKFIVGIDQGITEPTALQALYSLPNSEVRLFFSSKRLTENALHSFPKFHAKVFFIKGGLPSAIRFICVSSANLTAAALSKKAKNFEAGIYIVPMQNNFQIESHYLENWWEEAWKIAKPLNQRLLNQYTKTRESYLRKYKDIINIIEQPSPENVAEAGSLWIETGAMSGGSRNQIEFSEELASFFGRVVQKKKKVDFKIDNKLIRGRELRYKITDWGTEIWRLGLPTVLNYPNKVIHFKKISSKKGEKPIFEISINDINGNDSKSWFSLSNQSGFIGSTRGTAHKSGRRYGYY